MSDARRPSITIEFAPDGSIATETVAWTFDDPTTAAMLRRAATMIEHANEYERTPNGDDPSDDCEYPA